MGKFKELTAWSNVDSDDTIPTKTKDQFQINLILIRLGSSSPSIVSAKSRKKEISLEESDINKSFKFSLQSFLVEQSIINKITGHSKRLNIIEKQEGNDIRN